MVRYLGTFLENPAETPTGVVAYVARQLGIADPVCFAQYCVGEQRWEHAAEIHRRYGYRDFASGAVRCLADMDGGAVARRHPAGLSERRPRVDAPSGSRAPVAPS